MKEWLHNIREWLRRRLEIARLGRSMAVPAHSERTTRNYRKTDVINREDEGAFFYLHDVLDQLDQTRRLLRKLRRFHKDAYDYHSRMGAGIAPPGAGVAERLDTQFLKLRPSAGMAFVPETEKNFLPSLVYFEKLKRPEWVASSSREVYTLVNVQFYKNRPVAFRFHVDIDRSGEPQLLREKHTNTLVVQRKKSPEKFHISQPSWDYSEGLRWLYNEKVNHPDEYPEFDRAQSIEEWAQKLFSVSVNWYMTRASDELLVRCRKRSETVKFYVSTKRTPYFFRDRATTVAKDGRKKRVFHIVQAHDRILPNGQISHVKEHYRGERIFEWHGYDIHIVLPKKQEALYFDVPMHELEEDEAAPRGGYLTAAETADFVVDVLEGRR